MLGATVVEKKDLLPDLNIIRTSNNTTDITRGTEVAVVVIGKMGLPKMQSPVNRMMFTTINLISSNIPLISIRREVVAAILVVVQVAETKSGVGVRSELIVEKILSVKPRSHSALSRRLKSIIRRS
jgi:hypothetical protein